MQTLPNGIHRKTNKMRDFSSGDIRSHIIHLSWPMVVANLLSNVVSAFELYLIGTIGIEALAALAIVTSSVYSLYISVHGAVINGAIAMTSRFAGAKDYDKINRALPMMLAYSVSVFALFCGLMYVFRTPVLSFFGAKGSVLAMAEEYVAVLAFSFLPMALYSVFIGVFRGAGDSVTPLKVIMIMIVVSAVLNPVFIVVMKMGLKGAALANLCALAAASLAYIGIIFKGVHFFKFRAPDFRGDRQLLAGYSLISNKAIGQNFAADAGIIVLLKIMSFFGNEFLAAYGIVARLVFSIMMFGWPIGNSGGAILGQNLGIKAYDRVRRTVYEGIKVFSWITVPGAVLFLFFAPQIMSVFTDEPKVIEYGVYYMRVVAVFLPLLGVGLIIQSAFNGAGATGTPMAVNLIAYLGIRLLFAVVLAYHTPLKEYGIFWAISATVAAYTAIYWFLFKKGKWMTKEI